MYRPASSLRPKPARDLAWLRDLASVIVLFGVGPSLIPIIVRMAA